MLNPYCIENSGLYFTAPYFSDKPNCRSQLTTKQLTDWQVKMWH